MTFRRRYPFQFLGAAILLVFASQIAHAEDDPHHPIRMFVPCPAGSPADLSARTIAKWWSENSERKFYVENLPIRTANVGWGPSAAAFTDKYTMLFDLADCDNDASTPE